VIAHHDRRSAVTGDEGRDPSAADHLGDSRCRQRVARIARAPIFPRVTVCTMFRACRLTTLVLRPRILITSSSSDWHRSSGIWRRSRSDEPTDLYDRETAAVENDVCLTSQKGVQMIASGVTEPSKAMAGHVRCESICPGIAWANLVVFHWR
jgi:hypothetical protein